MILEYDITHMDPQFKAGAAGMILAVRHAIEQGVDMDPPEVGPTTLKVHLRDEAQLNELFVRTYVWKKEEESASLSCPALEALDPSKDGIWAAHWAKSLQTLFSGNSCITLTKPDKQAKALWKDLVKSKDTVIVKSLLFDAEKLGYDGTDYKVPAKDALLLRFWFLAAIIFNTLSVKAIDKGEEFTKVHRYGVALPDISDLEGYVEDLVDYWRGRSGGGWDETHHYLRHAPKYAVVCLPQESALSFLSHRVQSEQDNSHVAGSLFGFMVYHLNQDTRFSVLGSVYVSSDGDFETYQQIRRTNLGVRLLWLSNELEGCSPIKGLKGYLAPLGKEYLLERGHYLVDSTTRVLERHTAWSNERSDRMSYSPDFYGNLYSIFQSCAMNRVRGREGLSEGRLPPEAWDKIRELAVDWARKLLVVSTREKFQKELLSDIIGPNSPLIPANFDFNDFATKLCSSESWEDMQVYITSALLDVGCRRRRSSSTEPAETETPPDEAS